MKRLHTQQRPNRSDERPIVQRLAALRVRRHRDESGLFFADGVHFVIQAIEAGYKPVELVTCKALLVHPFGQILARRLRQAGVPTHLLDAVTFRSLTTSTEPQGIGVVLRQRWTTLDDARPADGLCWLAASRVRSPGNLGTVLRTAEAVGAAGLFTLGPAIDPFDPGTIRGSMGGIFNVRMVRTDPESLRRWARRHGCRIVGASGDGAVSYDAMDCTRPLVIVIGDERKGLSRRERAICDDLVRIPMVGRADSLNLGVAAGLMLYEALRRRPT